MRSHPLPTHPTKAEFRVVVELLLKAAEDAVAVLNEAEADEVVERLSHILTARARRVLSLLCLLLNQLRGVQLLQRRNSPAVTLGALLPPKLHHQRLPRSHQALFQTG
jgi:hypothetical protein